MGKIDFLKTSLLNALSIEFHKAGDGTHREHFHVYESIQKHTSTASFNLIRGENFAK